MSSASAFSLSAAEIVTLALAGVLSILIGMIGYRAWQRSRVTPEERERRRRATLVSVGKMGDATLIEIREHFIIYTYDVRGVEYTASQDVSLLTQYMPADLSTLGPLFVKYDPRNPANSIVVAESWTGMRAGKVV